MIMEPKKCKGTNLENKEEEEEKEAIITIIRVRKHTRGSLQFPGFWVTFLGAQC